ncbi:carboxypeptidase regulatory-like domain-containing protein, partial [Candidatus Micrarchaeota archaeon]|nr:carboxypeptidase regulatory-like domain-containing protein [Candidatus Micrarchaeota archaeon]
EFVVSAFVGSVVGNASVSVLASAPASVVVSLSNASIVAGESVDFDAVAFDEFGNVVSGALVAWSASGGSVNGSGSFSSNSAGSFVVTASVAGVSDVAFVRVVPSVVASYVISPSEVSSTVGGARQLRVDSFDSFGNLVGVVNSSNLSWIVFDGLGFVDESNVLYTNGAGRSKVTVQNKLNSSLFDEAGLVVVVPDSTGSSFSSGGGGGGGVSVPSKSRLGEPCRTIDDCSEGQCIDGFCALPTAALPVEIVPPVSLEQSPSANASVPVVPATPASLLASVSVPSSVQPGSDVVIEVFNADGAPLGGASVLVTRPDNGVFTVATLANGRARFNPVLEGVYSFKVEGFELSAPSFLNVSRISAPVAALLNATVANATVSGTDFGSLIAATASSSVSGVKSFIDSMPTWVLGALLILLVVVAVVVYTLFFGRDEGVQEDVEGGEGVSSELLEREEQEEKDVVGSSSVSLDKEGIEKTGLDSAVPVEASVKPLKRGKGKTVEKPALPASVEEEAEDLMKTLEMQLERLKKKREQRRQ